MLLFRLVLCALFTTYAFAGDAEDMRESRCTAKPVEEGGTGVITCLFKDDASKAQTIILKKEFCETGTSKTNGTVVGHINTAANIHVWEPVCKYGNDFTASRVTENVTFFIPDVRSDHYGKYWCEIADTHHPTQGQPCFFSELKTTSDCQCPVPGWFTWGGFSFGFSLAVTIMVGILIYLRQKKLGKDNQINEQDGKAKMIQKAEESESKTSYPDEKSEHSN